MSLKLVKKNQRKTKRSLNAILGRLDRGEITVKQAHGQMQEYDKKHVSKLDRFLEAIAG